MLLESIKLENFRQFRNESIDFAQGNDGKNVTIILGENGTGKTTFAQAFFWCLYGETEFSDKNMLNKIVATELRAGQNANVQVTLKLKHGEVCYTITREQKYHKDSANKIKSDNVVFDIAIKDQNGNTSYVKTTQCDSEIQKILPKELSRYFFFDGERIEKMGKDISNDRRAVDFADAVKGLLGLNAMDAAIKHFNPKSKYGVIGSYESSFDSKNNTKILEYTKKIDQYKTECEEIEAQIEELDRQISMAHTQKTHKSEEIKMYEDGAKLQQEKERLEQKILNEKKAKSASYKEICKTFNSHLSSFFSIALIRRALEIIAQGDFSGKDIPYMHSKTIEYLLKQKICICGTHLDEGSVPYQNVAELIQYLPPQSISTTIADFKKESRRRSDAMQDTFALIKERLEIVSHYDDQINDWRDDLQKIEAKLSGGDVREKVRIINNAIRMCDETIRKCSMQRDQKHQRRGSLQSQIERTQTERSNLTMLDEKNKKIEMNKLCAERIYQEIKETNEENEE